MYCITGQQIDFILNDISQHGIKMESLQCDLLDHICIIIEQNLEEEGDFEAFYASTIKAFYKRELREIEEETVFLLTNKNHWAFSRNQFFLLLFTIFIGPFIGYIIAWLATSGQTAGWNIPINIWGASLVYSLFPLLILLVLFLTPERLDPLIPKKSKIWVGIDPFIKIIPPGAPIASAV
jgi:hypothetical protein